MRSEKPRRNNKTLGSLELGVFCDLGIYICVSAWYNMEKEGRHTFVERKKMKLATVIFWCFNAMVWCVLFGLAVYFHQRTWIVLLYSANAFLGVFTAGMQIHQFFCERKF